MQTTPFVTVRASRPPTEMEFCAWVTEAAPGDALEYYRGFLIIDRISGGRLAEGDRAELERVARRVLWAAKQGFVHLVQKKHRSHDYSYLAIARARPTTCTRARPALLAESAEAIHGQTE